MHPKNLKFFWSFRMVQVTIKITKNLIPPCWTFMTECTLLTLNTGTKCEFSSREKNLKIREKYLVPNTKGQKNMYKNTFGAWLKKRVIPLSTGTEW